MGWDDDGTFYVASELKALEYKCTKIELFPPGNYLYSNDEKLKKWYQYDWSDFTENVDYCLYCAGYAQPSKFLSNAFESESILSL